MTSESKNHYFAYLLLFISIVIFGIYTGIQKQALAVISNPFNLAIYILVFSTLFLLPSASSAYKTHKVKIDRKLVGSLVILSLITQFAAFSIKLFALSFTTATSVGFITSFSAVFLTIYAFLLTKEVLPKNFFVILIFMTAGLILFRYVPDQGIFNFGKGELLMLVFVNLVSFSNVYVKRISSKYPSEIISLGRMLFAIPVLFLIVVFTSEFKLDEMFSFWPVIGGLFLAGRSYTQYKAIQITHLSNVALAYVVGPVITFVYAYFALNESLSIVQILGASMIALGAYLIMFNRKRFTK